MVANSIFGDDSKPRPGRYRKSSQLVRRKGKRDGGRQKVVVEEEEVEEEKGGVRK